MTTTPTTMPKGSTAAVQPDVGNGPDCSKAKEDIKSNGQDEQLSSDQDSDSDSDSEREDAQEHLAPSSPPPTHDTKVQQGNGDQGTNDPGRQAQHVAQAAATAVAVPVAANAVAVAATTALGFQAGGIAAGSAAAAMMSSAAVANGGAIAAGSAVATMQSIGATGVAFGPVGWILFGAIGLVAGGVVAFFRHMDEQKRAELAQKERREN